MESSQTIQGSRKIANGILSLVALCMLNLPAFGQNPQAKQGIMDLRGFDAAELDSIRLEGEWRFYWKQLLEPADFLDIEKSSAYTYQESPKDWIFYDIEGENLGSHGYATLYLKVLLPSIDEDLAMRVMPIVMAGNIFVNGSLIHQAGQILDQKEKAGHRFDQTIIPLGKNLSELEIIIQMSNHMITRSAYAAVELGTMEHMIHSEILYYKKTMFLLGGIFLMAIYHICLFALRRRDRSNLFFSGVCIANGLFVYVASGAAAWNFPQLDSEAIWDLFFFFWFSGAPCFAYFVHSIFPKHFSKKMGHFSLVVAVVTIAYVLILPTDMVHDVPKSHHALNFALFFYASWACFRAFRHKESGPLLFALGLTIYFIGIVNDMLVTKGLMKGELLSASGLFIFLFFQSILLSRRFSNAFKQLEVAEIEIRSLNEGLEAKVIQKTRDIRAILSTIKQGIFTLRIDQDHQIRLNDDYSQHLEEILGQADLSNRLLSELILEASDLSSDQKSIVLSSIAAAIGEDELGFIVNKANFIAELSYKGNGQEKILELDWEPMLGVNGNVEQILVSIRDVTSIRQLQAQSIEQQKELEYISEIVNTTAEQFSKFINMAYSLLDENERLIKHNSHKNIEAIKILFINMHTIKGAARTYHFRKMTGILHDAEQQYADLLRIEDFPWNQIQLLQDVKDVRTTLELYDQINSDKLGRKRDVNLIELNRKIFEEKVKSLNLINTSFMNTKDRDIIEDTKKTFNAAFYNRSIDVLEDILSGSERIARDLGKEIPIIKIDDPGFSLNYEAQELLSQVFNHIIRNSLDHGIETASERVSMGKRPTGIIHLSLEQHQDRWLALNYHDDGRGLNLAKLREIGLEKGMLDAHQNPSDHDIAQLIFESGLSTSNSLTEISGRGVGMDAVKQYIESAGGTIDIELNGTPRNGYCPFALKIRIPSDLFTLAA